MTQEEQYLDLLGTFHYVVAGVAGLFSLFPVLHLVMGIALATGAMGEPDQPFPLRVMGVIFILFASAFILCGLTFAAFVWRAGTCLRRRRKHMFCLVMAGVECMFMPFGTVLGIFTLILLTKAQTRALFEPPAAVGGG